VGFSSRIQWPALLPKILLEIWQEFVLISWHRSSIPPTHTQIITAMNDRDTRRLVRAQNVLTFFKNNSADFAPTSIVHEHISKIGNSVALVTAARAGQSPNRVTKASLLDALLLDLKRIAATPCRGSCPLRPDGQGQLQLSMWRSMERLQSIRTRCSAKCWIARI